MSYSMDIVKAIRKNLEDSGVKQVSFNEEKGMFSFVTHVGAGISYVDCIVDVNENEFLVITRVPVLPYGEDDEVREAIRNLGEFVCRANYGLKNGCFEMDWKDGEIRYRTFVDCDGQLPSQDIIHNSIGVSVAMVKRYGRGILDVIYKGMDPEIAVMECEGSFRFHTEEMQEELQSLMEEIASGAPEEEPAEADEAGDVSENIPSYQHFLSMTDAAEAEEIFSSEEVVEPEFTDEEAGEPECADTEADEPEYADEEAATA